MCSVQDVEDGIQHPETPVKKLSLESILGRTCMKCEEKASVIIRVNDAFCRNCFLAYCTHKFRSAFGKSKVVRDGETVLVGFSGGQGSSAVLHLIQEGLSKRAQKKLRFSPVLLFIDEGAVIQQTEDERKQQNQQVSEIMKKSGYPSYISTLEQVFKIDTEPCNSSAPVPSSIENVDVLTDQIDQLNFDTSLQSRLSELLDSVKTVTAKEELIKKLRARLLVHLAGIYSCSKVIVGDSSTRLSVQLLADLAQGRGAHTSLETGFADERHEGVTVIRPLRDFTSKEVAMYTTFTGCEVLVLPTLSTKMPANTSIGKLTEDFVSGLQTEFSSTVSTVFRTGEKLTLADKSASDIEKCVMCQAPLDTDVPEASALNATLFSQSLSQAKQDVEASQNCLDNTDCCGEGDGSCKSQADMKIIKDLLNHSLCYGCRLVVKDMSNIDTLPRFILDEAAKRDRRNKMKESIQEFLLTE